MPSTLRFNYLVSFFTTALATGALAMVHPAMPILLAYDYYLLFGFTKVLNQTTFAILLDESKRGVFINRLNFLGYHTKFEEKRYLMSTVKFIGVYTNEYVTLNNKGLLPSISRLMNMQISPKKKENDLNQKTGAGKD